MPCKNRPELRDLQPLDERPPLGVRIYNPRTSGFINTGHKDSQTPDVRVYNPRT